MSAELDKLEELQSFLEELPTKVRNISVLSFFFLSNDILL